MAVDPTPWLVGGGAKHSPESIRAQTYSNTGGGEGVSAADDLLVVAADVPAGKVLVRPGGGTLLNRYAGGDRQSYSIRNISNTEVAVTATGSGGGRSDLVIARVLDPQYEGQAPTDPNAFQYTRLSTIQGVAASVRSAADLNLPYPAIALARIDIPKSTGTVTAGMITDLRQLTQPKRKEYLLARPRFINVGDPSSHLTAKLNAPSEWFPGGAQNGNAFHVDVPSWARRIMIEATWISVKYDGTGNGWGDYWIEYGTQYINHGFPGGKNYEFTTRHFSWDQAEKGSAYRTNWILADTYDVPASLRGQTIDLTFCAALNASATGSPVYVDAYSGLSCRVTFTEEIGAWINAN